MSHFAMGMSWKRQERQVKESDAVESNTHNGRFRHAVWALSEQEPRGAGPNNTTETSWPGCSLALCVTACLLPCVGDDQHPRTLDSPACCPAARQNARRHTGENIHRFACTLFCSGSGIRSNRPHRSAQVRTGPQAHAPGNQHCLGFYTTSLPGSFTFKFLPNI
jgi:hypothetical protein